MNNVKTIMIHGKTIPGYVVLPLWLRKRYFEAHPYCSICKKKLTLSSMRPHRKIRKNKGGLYTVIAVLSRYSNIQILCLDCHRVVHQRENRAVNTGY